MNEIKEISDSQERITIRISYKECTSQNEGKNDLINFKSGSTIDKIYEDEYLVEDLKKIVKDMDDVNFFPNDKDLTIEKSGLINKENEKTFLENLKEIAKKYRRNIIVKYEEYKIKISSDNLPQTDNTEIALSVIRDQLSDLQNQQNKICELLEKGTYTVEMFTKRNDLLQKEMKKLQQSEKDIMNKQSAAREKRSTEEKIIPTTQHILDSYDQLTATEKNELWKMVMEKITAYRTPEGEFSIHIYPKLPK